MFFYWITHTNQINTQIQKKFSFVEMTKSGIGTQQQQPQQVSSAPSPANGQSGTSTTTTSASLIANAEIPIWVADKKKWVTGISKKTTINDLIFAILKQCQIVGASGGKPGEPTHAAQSDLITNQYVLVEYQFEPNTNSNSYKYSNTNNNSN